MEGTCEGCKYASVQICDNEDITMKCQRFPPQLFIDTDGILAQSFPDADKRCGEYKSEEEPIILQPKHFGR